MTWETRLLARIRLHWKQLASTTRVTRLVVALAALILFPGRAVAHIRVSGSSPAAGSTVRTPVRAIQITFSQRVAPRFTRLALVGPDGVEVQLSNLTADSTQREFVAALDRPLTNGSYSVRWRTAGADGHVLSGEYRFVVDAAPAEVVVADSTRTDAVADPGNLVNDQGTVRDANSRPAAVLVRWTNFIVLLLALGAVAFRVLVLPTVQASDVPAEFGTALDSALRRLGMLSGLLVILAAVPRLLLQTSALAGEAAMFAGDVIGPLLQSPWGIGWLLQVAGGLALLGAALLKSRSLAVVAAIGLAVSPGLSGHAVAVEPGTFLSVANDAAHVLAAATWLGSLLLIVLLALPLALRFGGAALSGLAVTVRAFSPLALTAAAVLLLTGSAATLMHTSSLVQLWTTVYGRTLLIKLGLVAVVAALGYHHWKRVRPALGSAASTQQFRKSALLELGLGAAVLFVTALVVALPTPP
jgi:putative copper export protein/methionine-rich copper-binding protein CopC